MCISKSFNDNESTVCQTDVNGWFGPGLAHESACPLVRTEGIDIDALMCGGGYLDYKDCLFRISLFILISPPCGNKTCK